MYGIFVAIWNGIKWVFGLIMPVFAKAKDVRAMGSKLRWVLHFLFLAVILVGLGYLNYAFEIDKLLTPPYPLLRRLWLPILFLIIYLLSWLGWWLWKLLGSEEETSDFPDVDSAWEEAVAALGQAGISLAESPLFILLGKPVGGFHNFFAGAQMKMIVDQTPARPDAPVSVYANEEGIFVTCAGSSLLGKLIDTQLSPTAGRPGTQRQRSERPTQEGGEEHEEENANEEGEHAQQQDEEGGEGGGRAGVGTAIMRRALKPGATATTLLKDTATVDEMSARLKHLCWLILKDRRPYCPLNGILLLLPFEATRDESTANQTGLVCHRDLVSLQQVMQLYCPIFTLICDMELTPGFREFIDRFPRGHRRRRLGQQFPYLSDNDRSNLAHIIDQGVSWITDNLFPPLIYRLMRVERAGRDKPGAVLRGNMRLFFLFEQIRQRRRHLSRLLSLTFADPTVPVLFGGCYFAATGTDPDHEQAFIPAALHRLLENQNYISWTQSARAEEQDYRRWTRYGYVALGAFVCTFFAMLIWYTVRS